MNRLGADSPFDRRLMVVLGGFAFVCFAWAFQAALTSPSESHDTEGDDVYGRGPLGFRGLMETLDALAVPVRVHRRAITGLDGGDFVVLTLPMLDADARKSLRGALDEWRAGDALIVLPKWQRRDAPAGLAASESTSDTQRVEAVTEGEVNTLLRGLGFDATVTSLGPDLIGVARFSDADADADADADLAYGLHTRAARGFAEAEPADAEAEPADAEAEPADGNAAAGPVCVLRSEHGCLALQVARRNRTMTLLADPDLLNNHGLVRAQNGALSVALIDRLRRGAPVVLDATLHGYTVPELWSALLRAPLVYPMLQLALLAALWALAGSGRFGAPRRDFDLATRPPVSSGAIPERSFSDGPLGSGRQVLVENTVELLHRGGHSAHMLLRYWHTTVRDLAHLNRLAGEEHAIRLRALGLALHRTDDLNAVDADVASAAARRLDARAIARLAKRIHGLRPRPIQS